MWGKWWMYFEHLINYDPDEFGVYELGDAGKNTIYYGSGKIKTRLLDHINKKNFPLAKYYRFELSKTEPQCRKKEKALLESYEEIHGKLPMYNERN